MARKTPLPKSPDKPTLAAVADKLVDRVVPTRRSLGPKMKTLVVIVAALCALGYFVVPPLVAFFAGKKMPEATPSVTSVGTVNGPAQVGSGNVQNNNIQNISVPVPEAGTEGRILLPGTTIIGTCNGCVIFNGVPPNTDVAVLHARVASLGADSGGGVKPPDTHGGFEIGLMLSLGEPIPGRDNFILDLGLAADSNRVSILLDPDRSIQFRVVDADSKPHVVVVRHSLRTFRFASVMFLFAEYGIVGRTAFLRVAIDGRDVGYEAESSPLHLAQGFLPLNLGTMNVAFGSDFHGNNGGVFAVAAAAFARETFTSTEEDNVISATDGILDSGQVHFIAFSGSQSLMGRHRAGGAGP